MAWRRQLIEAIVYSVSRCLPVDGPPENPEGIFVLRNNDLGDLLIITPLFEALKRRFPGARLSVGVGAWNRETLLGNPFIDDVLTVNAPWCNRVTGSKDAAVIARYLLTSNEVRDLRARHFDVGIDVLGSHWGSLLLMRAGIRFRLGVRGYAGGHTGAQRVIDYDGDEHVGRAALRFAELLGSKSLPSLRPQIYLTQVEHEAAARLWAVRLSEGARIVVAPGGGYPGRAWPADSFVELTRLLIAAGHGVCVIGGPQDVQIGARLTEVGARDLTGQLSLRESFGVIASAHLVCCNSSVAMQAAAAFHVPALVMLGPDYPSARAHARQWGLPGETEVLGCEPNRVQIFTPQEVVARVPGDLVRRPAPSLSVTS